MSGILSADELSALQEPYAGPKQAERAVTRAVFPSVAQLDAESAAALDLAMKRWMETLSRDLAGHLRVSCAPTSPRQRLVPRATFPGPEEQPFWAEVEGVEAAHVLLTLPSPFAAALCERVFGAPFAIRPPRALSRAEVTFLRETAHTWFGLLGRALSGPNVRLCRVSESEELTAAADEGNWLQFTCPIRCGEEEAAFVLSMDPNTARVLLGADPGAPESKPSGKRLLSLVGDVPLVLRAILGRADLSLDELSGLRIGDIIGLDRRTADPIEIAVGDRTCFLARAGRAGQMVAFELIEQRGEVTNVSMESMPGQPSAALGGGADAAMGADAAALAAAGGTPFGNTMDFLMDVRLTVSVEVGRVQLPVRKVMSLGPGSVVELPRSATEPVEIYANGRCIGKGEIVVVGDQFGVRVTEIGG